LRIYKVNILELKLKESLDNFRIFI